MYTTFNKLRIGQLFEFEGGTFEKVNDNQAIATQNDRFKMTIVTGKQQ